MSGKLPLNLVDYAVYPDRQIVFTGLHNSRDGQVGSTINFAESVIMEIAKAEDIDPTNYKFYDLQTKRGYCGYKSGDYRINELQPYWSGGKIINLRWIEGYCREEVLRLFDQHIRYGDPRIPYRNLAVVCGAIPQLLHGQMEKKFMLSR